MRFSASVRRTALTLHVSHGVIALLCTCGAHVCWKCLKSFKDSGKCYDHLSKECGGIFDANLANVL